VAFSELIRTLRGTDKPLRGAPLPAAWLYRALRAAEATGIRAPFRADSLLGLVQPAPDVPHVGEWAARGIALRDFTAD